MTKQARPAMALRDAKIRPSPAEIKKGDLCLTVSNMLVVSVVLIRLQA